MVFYLFGSKDLWYRQFYLIMYRCTATLYGHTAELTACHYDFSYRAIASSSLDGTAKLWDVRRTDSCRHSIAGHTDEVVKYSILCLLVS